MLIQRVKVGFSFLKILLLFLNTLTSDHFLAIVVRGRTYRKASQKFKAAMS